MDDGIDLNDLEDITLDFGKHGIVSLSPTRENRSINRSRAYTASSRCLESDFLNQEYTHQKRPKWIEKKKSDQIPSKFYTGSDLKRIVQETKSKTEALINEVQNQNEQIKRQLSTCGTLCEERTKTKGIIGNKPSMSEIPSVVSQESNQKEEKKLISKTNQPCRHLPDPSQPLPPLPPMPCDFRTTDIERCMEILKAGEILPLHTVKFICEKLSELLMKESNVRNIASPVTVVGDVHGQFYDLMEMFKIGGEVPSTNYLFLGDYVDRGHYCVETFSYLGCLKMRYPDRITLIRGNHESRTTTTHYGFMTECTEKYGTMKAWEYFTNMFDYLPIAATIDGEIFATHGGLSPTLHTIDSMRVIFRFIEIPTNGSFCDLMWADPDADGFGFKISERMCSYTFGKDVFEKFMHINKLSYMIRAHQLCQNGYQVVWNNFATVWSAPNYMYRLKNKAAICEISDHCRSKYFNVYEKAPDAERPNFEICKKKEARATHYDV